MFKEREGQERERGRSGRPRRSTLPVPAPPVVALRCASRPHYSPLALSVTSDGATSPGNFSRPVATGVPTRVERFDGRATEPFELLNDQNSNKFVSEFRKIYQNSREIVKFEEVLVLSCTS